MTEVDDRPSRLARIRDEIESEAPLAAADLAFLKECLDDSNKRAQRAAAECFAKLVQKDRRHRATLMQALESSRSRERWGATFALSLIDEFPPAALDTAVQTLDTDDRDLRWAAADLLKRSAEGANPGALDRLCATARVGTLLQRRMALYALRALATNDARAVEASYEALAESDVELRLAGLATLARHAQGSRVAAARVIALLDDAEPRIRRAAAASLGSFGCRSSEVMRAIEGALASEDPSVRQAAKKALERLGSTSD